MESQERHSGDGRIVSATGEAVAAVRYEYQIDRRNRVWRGTARRTDGGASLSPPAGPAGFETAQGWQAAINYYQRPDDDGVLIVFTGRGAPPGESP